jgi:hypothetical protein
LIFLLIDFAGVLAFLLLLDQLRLKLRDLVVNLAEMLDDSRHFMSGSLQFLLKLLNLSLTLLFCHILLAINHFSCSFNTEFLTFLLGSSHFSNSLIFSHLLSIRLGHDFTLLLNLIVLVRLFIFVTLSDILNLLGLVIGNFLGFIFVAFLNFFLLFIIWAFHSNNFGFVQFRKCRFLCIFISLLLSGN